MADLQVHVLGKLRLDHNGAVIDHFPTRRVEELLAFLLLHQKRDHPREKLIELLWPESKPTNGRASLSTALWRLRNVFVNLGLEPQSFIQSRNDSISLDPLSPLLSDLAVFEGNLARAQKERGLEKRENLLRQAIETYHGGFCEGLYAEWCLVERERLERRYLWALGQLMADLIQQKSYEDAITCGKAILEKDPIREEVHRALMICHFELGNTAISLRQFQICARLLQEELGILPLPETIEIQRRILESRFCSVNGQSEGRTNEKLAAAYERYELAAKNLDATIKEIEGSRYMPEKISPISD